MTELLERLIPELEKLSEEEQDMIAKLDIVIGFDTQIP